MNKILFHDTTLRDGEQTPGIAFSLSDKIKITNILYQIGLDIIEVGFPAASENEKNNIKKISKLFKKKNTILCAFSRAKESDIEIAYESLKEAKKSRIQVVAPSSNIHLKYSINTTKKQLIKNLRQSICKARGFFEDIQFTAQDAPRAEKKFLKELIDVAIDSGATTISLPDTTGFCSFEEYSMLISEIKDYIKKFKKVFISAHCHNDLGLATANTIAAINSGARQVECTINGLGERAGNAPLEEVLAILDLKYKNLLKKNIRLKKLAEANVLLEKIIGIKTHNNKPVFGKNVFTHASGMHQKAVIENKNSFEILKAEKFGLSGGKISIGKLSGKAGIKKILNDLKVSLSGKQIESLTKEVKKYSLREKELSNSKLKQIIKKIK